MTTAAEPKAGGRGSSGSDSFDQISAVACRIFREKGYHATSMRAIATALGMQPAALYYWYEGKEDLLFNIMNNAVDQLTARVQAAIDRDAPAETQLRQAIHAHIVSISDHLDELTVFLHEMKSLNGKRREIVQAKSNRFEHIFRDILIDGVRRGEFVGVDARLARFMIMSGCNWLYNWYKPNGPYTPEQIADAFTDMILKGLLPR